MSGIVNVLMTDVSCVFIENKRKKQLQYRFLSLRGALECISLTQSNISSFNIWNAKTRKWGLAWFLTFHQNLQLWVVQTAAVRIRHLLHVISLPLLTLSLQLYCPLVMAKGSFYEALNHLSQLFRKWVHYSKLQLQWPLLAKCQAAVKLGRLVGGQAFN